MFWGEVWSGFSGLFLPKLPSLHDDYLHCDETWINAKLVNTTYSKNSLENMVMKMSVDIKYRKCIVTVTFWVLCARFLRLFCVHSSLWYFVFTDLYGILCAQFLVVFCVHSSLWYFVCTVPYGILCAQFLVDSSDKDVMPSLSCGRLIVIILWLWHKFLAM